MPISFKFNKTIFSKIGSKIGLKLLIPYITISAFSLCLLVGVLYYSYQNQSNSIQKIQEEISNQANSEVQFYLSKIADELKLLSFNVSCLECFATNDLLLKNLAAIQPSVSKIAILNEKGREIQRHSRYESKMPTMLDEDYKDESFKRAITGGLYISSVHISEYNLPSIFMSVPIINKTNKAIGVVVTEVDLSPLWGVISKIKFKNTGYAYIVDKDGQIIVYKDTAFVEKKPDITNVQGVKNFLTHNAGYFKYQSFNNEPVFGNWVAVKTTGWGLIVELPTKEIFKENMVIFLISIFSFLISLLFVWIMLRIIYKNLSVPLQSMRKGIDEIHRGNMDIHLEINKEMKDNEIGELTETFNNMALQLRESYNTLEDKVKEQTKEIHNQIDELKNQKDAVLNVLEDVEKEKEKSELLSNDLKKFQLAVENASDQIVITNQEGLLVYVNKAVEKMTGFKPEEVLNQKIDVVWGGNMPLSYYENLWNTVKVQKKVYVGEIQNKKKDGVLYTASISVSPVLDNQGEIIYFVAIEHDITKEKEIDKAKTEFVSLASHQLRTPLSAINWYTEMLLAGDAGEINEEQKKYLVEVAIGNKRMVELVDALLNVSRLDLGTFIIEPEPINVVDVSKSVLAELKPGILEREQKVEEHYDDNLGTFHADQKLLRILFQNLLSNAVKYTPKNGTIRVEVHLLKAGDKFDTEGVEVESLGFMIADSGMGIPAKQQDKVFQKLFRADNARETETEGTGLGLYLIKSIVDQSGGKVWFKSEENKGTTFYIVFPRTGMKKKAGTKQLD